MTGTPTWLLAHGRKEVGVELVESRHERLRETSLFGNTEAIWADYSFA
jgi:hypothetical protein